MIFEAEFEAHSSAVNVLRIKGEYLFSGGDKLIRLWNTNDLKMVQSYISHGYEVFDVAVCVLG